MAVKILIKRMVPETKEKELMPFLKELRNMAISRPGYISGETLERVDKPGEYMVISTWQSAAQWREWVLSKDRIEIQEKIDALLGEKTEYAIYNYA
jgi:heme-degrading monooxygenase HmoA